MAFNLLILVSEKILNYENDSILHLFLSSASWQIQLRWNEELSRSLHAFVLPWQNLMR